MALFKASIVILVAVAAAGKLRNERPEAYGGPPGFEEPLPPAIPGDLVPQLTVPREHDKFFKHDYPHDEHPPRGQLHFGPIYPLPQHDDTFDDDFVDDSDNDGGAYDAQMNYDLLRHRFSKELNDVIVARENLEKEAKEYAAAQKETDVAAAAAAKATAKADKFRHRFKEVMKAAKLEDIAKAKAEVGKAKKAVTEQKKVLEDAKETVHKLLKTHHKLDAKMIEARKKAHAVMKVATHEDNDHTDEGALGKLEKRYAVEEREHIDAQVDYESAQSELKQAEVDLKAAEERLRKARNARAASPAEYKESKLFKIRKSFASGLAPSLALIALCFALGMA